MTNQRTDRERASATRVAEIFESCPDSVQTKLENFPKYVRRQHLKRFLALYEIFKHILPVKGSIVECGVFRGFGLMSWAKLSTILEPENLTRRVYGFDSFSGFPEISKQDENRFTEHLPGELAADCYDELTKLISQYDDDRFLGHIDKVHLIKGDVVDTIPAFVNSNPHLVISLLFLDLDLYEPTVVALKHLVPRMPRGAVLAFDELDNPQWPGETHAVIHQLGLGRLRLRRLEWDPYIAFAVLD
jgi:hypothetical protein